MLRSLRWYCQRTLNPSQQDSVTSEYVGRPQPHDSSAWMNGTGELELCNREAQT